MFQNIRKVLKSKYLEHSKHFELFTKKVKNVLGGRGENVPEQLKKVPEHFEMFLNILKVPGHICKICNSF